MPNYNETGFDKISLLRGTKQELIDNKDKINEYEIGIAKDTKQLVYKENDEIVEFNCDKILKFDTVQDLVNYKKTNVGDVVEIIGYYDKNDGATHKRIITNNNNSGLAVWIDTGKFADLLHSGDIDVKTLGIRENEDCTRILTNAIKSNKVVKINLNKLNLTCPKLDFSGVFHKCIEDGGFVDLHLDNCVNFEFRNVQFSKLNTSLLSRNVFDHCVFKEAFFGYDINVSKSITVWNKFDRCEFYKTTMRSNNRSNGFCNMNTFINSLFLSSGVVFEYGATGYGMENINFIACDLGSNNVFQAKSEASVVQDTFINTYCCYFDGNVRMNSNNNIKIMDMGGMWVDADSSYISKQQKLETIFLTNKRGSFLPIRTQQLTPEFSLTLPNTITNGTGPFIRKILTIKRESFTDKYSFLIKMTSNFPNPAYVIKIYGKDGSLLKTTNRSLWNDTTNFNNEYCVIDVDVSDIQDIEATIELSAGVPNGKTGTITFYECYGFAGIATLPIVKTNTIDTAALDTPYMMTLMTREGVDKDFINYMDSEREYKSMKKQKEENLTKRYELALKENPNLIYEEFMSKQPMSFIAIPEPQPSQALLEFAKKYL